jgi:hypothetical protein
VTIIEGSVRSARIFDAVSATTLAGVATITAHDDTCDHRRVDDGDIEVGTRDGPSLFAKGEGK